MNSRRALFAVLALAVVALLVPAAPARGDGPVFSRPFAGEEHRIRRLELRDAKVLDAIRLISEISGLNVVATSEAATHTVSLYLQDVTAGLAVETVCKVAGLWYRRDEDTNTFRVMTTEEYQKDHIVYRKDEIKVFTLQHPTAIVVAQAIEDLFGDRVQLSLGIDEQEASDMPGGVGGGYGGYGGAGSYGQTGHGSGYGASNLGGISQRARAPDRYLRRPTGSRGTTRHGGDSERILDEPLTPDQIARLEAPGQTGAPLTAEQLQGISRRDPTIYVTVNRQHNLIVVRTSDTVVMKEIERLVMELDRPTPQVLLEMKILALTVGDSFRSVFDVQTTAGPTTSGPATTQPANPLLPIAPFGSRNTLGVGNFDLEDNRLVYQFLTDSFSARLQLLAEDNRVQVLATPVILASNNRPARMFVGEERVLTTGVDTDIVTPATGATTSVISPVTEVRDIGNTLIVVPKINADRTVTLFIVQDSSTVNPNSATIPVAGADGTITAFPIDTVNTANIQATVVAKDGLTMAVGGLIRGERTNRNEKVPFLGDIPVLNTFFRRKIQENSRSELLLLIKPRVVFTPAEADAATRRRMSELTCDPCVKEELGYPTEECEPCPPCPDPQLFPPIPEWRPCR